MFHLHCPGAGQQTGSDLQSNAESVRVPKCGYSEGFPQVGGAEQLSGYCAAAVRPVEYCFSALEDCGEGGCAAREGLESGYLVRSSHHRLFLRLPLRKVRSTQRVSDHSSALKFLYKAQAILVKARDKGVSRSSPIYLMTHVMTFVVLWRAKQYRDAQDYARICEDLVAKEIYELPEAGGYSRNREIVVGLIRLGQIACTHQLTENSQAIPALQSLLNSRPAEPLFLLISAVLKDLQTLPKWANAPASLDYVRTTLGLAGDAFLSATCPYNSLFAVHWYALFSPEHSDYPGKGLRGSERKGGRGV